MFLCSQRIRLDGKWIEAIEAHSIPPFNGMVCIKHFVDADIISVANSRDIRLKKRAVPTIVDSSERSHYHPHDDENDIEVKVDEDFRILRSCENCEILKAEYNELKSESLLAIC